MLVRFTSPLLVFGITLRSWFWTACRSARQRSRLTAGVATVVLAAVLGVTVGLLAGSASPAHAASDPHGIPNAPAAGAASHHQPGATQHPAVKHAAGQHAGPQHGPGQHGPSQNGPSQHGAARAGASQHAAAPQHRAAAPVPATPAQPYSIYDSVTPSAIPAGQQAVATYANGQFASSGSAVSGRGSVLWIDVTGSAPWASALDVEPGDASPAAAASWAWHKLHNDPSSLARIYTMKSEWPSVRAAVKTLPSQMQSHVRYWIADPTGVQHLLPGSSATQWYWGTHYDITTANPGF